MTARPGPRPRLVSPQRVMVHLSGPTVEAVDRIADQEQRSRSEIIRRAVEQYVEREDSP